MSAVWQGWQRFWFASAHPLPWAATRIAVALAGLYLWAGTAPELARYYTDAGEYPIWAAREWTTEYVARHLMFDALGSPIAVYLLAALHFALLIGLLVGFRTRLCAVGTAFLTQWFFFRNAVFVNGGDEVVRLATLYVAIGAFAVPREAMLLSLDRRLLGAPDAIPPPIPAWPTRIVQAQVCLVYLVSGLWKLWGASWWDGSALYLPLANSTFSRFGVPPWPALELPFTVLGIAILWWEFLFSVLVWIPRLRAWVLGFGVALHGGIMVFMNIGVFPVAMLACYPAFLHHEAFLRWGHWLRRVVRGGSLARSTVP